jgi:PTH1 family peptidyl-tRNA hydrolase
LYLIAGLGNPGPEYRYTRHNIGFQVVNAFSRELGVHLKGRRFHSINTLAKLKGKDVILLCPKTFMNLSGKAIKTCADYYNIKLEKVLIIHDDLDLPLGKIKVVRQGSAGGHKGIQSIINVFGSVLFPRVKIGIGRPQHGEDIEDYVLSPFYNDQKDIIKEAIPLAALACRLFVLDGLEVAMNHINTDSGKE